MKNIEYVLPNEIEKRSFEIIEKELENRNIRIPIDQKSITMRVIHTSADFDYATTMKYSFNAIEIAKNLILSGADIVTDTNMAKAGINSSVIKKFGGQVHCFMSDLDVIEEAKKNNTTRAAASMKKASRINKPIIFALGNAPTAMIALHDMIENNEYTPSFVIGVPVGFVNVVAAKELFINSKIPYIINEGRKGGSSIAAAICNALLYELGGRN